MKKILIALLCLLSLAAAVQADTLTDYMAKPEPGFGYTELSRTELPQALRCELSMNSVSYKDAQWKHRITVIVPKTVTVPDTALVFAVMGGALDEMDKYAGMIGSLMGCPLAIVWDVPNKQPGLSDDGAIAASIQAAMSGQKTEDIMLFPMAKSVIKALDVCDDYLPKAGAKASKYVIGGPSKDGWITWLAAASGDKRIAGIVPVIFDFLNMEKQLALQKESYGRYSDMIKEYTAFEALLSSDKNKEVLKAIDPATYAPRIKVPKLIINASNDSYWNIASANLYFDSLPGDKYLYYVMNMDHGKTLDGSPLDPLSLLPVFNTVAHFTEKCAGASEMPAPTWTWTTVNGALRCTVKAPAGAEISSASAFIAQGATKDLRKSKFSLVPMTKAGNMASVTIKPEGSYKAAVCRISLVCDNKPYDVWTTPRVIEPDK